MLALAAKALLAGTLIVAIAEIGKRLPTVAALVAGREVAVAQLGHHGMHAAAGGLACSDLALDSSLAFDNRLTIDKSLAFDNRQQHVGRLGVVVDDALGKKALGLAAAKLPVKTRFIHRLED